MGKKKLAGEKIWLVVVALILGRVGWGQTVPTEPLPTPLTPWICVPPTVPSYTACSGHPDVVPDVYPFRTGCYDIRTGTPGDCQESWILYATPEMIRRLTELSKRYVEWYEEENGQRIRVSFNDLSLIWGGIFDYESARRWDCPHALHRAGRSADVNTRGRPWIIKNIMDEIARKECGLKEMHTKPGDKNIHLEMQ